MTSEKFITEMIGPRIKALREEKGYTQAELEEYSGISLSQISKTESGERTNLELSTLCAIADALEVPLAQLLVITDWGVDKNNNSQSKKIKLSYDKDLRYQIIHDMEQHIMFYPPASHQYPITTIMDFLVILPLISLDDLYEQLARIGGEVLFYEDYICQCMERLYKSIPNSHEKQHAEKILNELKNYRLDPQNYTLHHITNEEEINFFEYLYLLEKKRRKNMGDLLEFKCLINSILYERSHNENNCVKLKST